MSVRLLRSVRTLALVGAVTVALPAPASLAEPGTGTPPPGSSGGGTSGGTQRPEDAAVSPADRAPSALLRKMQTLYRQTEESTEAYDATQEDLKQAQQKYATVNSRLALARKQLAKGRADTGRLARLQYQGADSARLASYLRLLLAKDPEQAMDQGHFLQEAAADQAATVARLTAAEKKADALAKEARAALDERQQLTDRSRKQRDTVQGKLKEVEGMLASLSEEQLTELSRLEEQGVARAQRAVLSDGKVREEGDGDGEVGEQGPPSAAGERALEYVLRQVGKPYRWGAAGPNSFDCSGLTSQAWSHAGRPIPRTSQQQWKRLPHVPLNQLRPSDLVFYFRGATHVAMYIGDGKVVQAPRPGRRVEIAPIASNPLLGAARPDPGETADPGETPYPWETVEDPGEEVDPREAAEWML